MVITLKEALKKGFCGENWRFTSGDLQIVSLLLCEVMRVQLKLDKKKIKKTKNIRKN